MKSLLFNLHKKICENWDHINSYVSFLFLLLAFLDSSVAMFLKIWDVLRPLMRNFSMILKVRSVTMRRKSVGRRRYSLYTNQWVLKYGNTSFVPLHSLINNSSCDALFINFLPQGKLYPSLLWGKCSGITVPAAKPSHIGTTCPHNFLYSIPQFECTFLSP